MPESHLVVAIVLWVIAFGLIVHDLRSPSAPAASTADHPRERPRWLVCIGCDDLMEDGPDRFFCDTCWRSLPPALRLRVAEGWRSDRAGETHSALGAALDQARAHIQEPLPHATAKKEG